MKRGCGIVTVVLILLLTLLVAAIALAQGPTICDVEAGDITDTSATITWVTNEAGNSTVNYGNTIPPGLTASDSAFVTNHSISLGNLTPATVYYYEVISTKADGNTTVDDNCGDYYTFTTFSDRLELEGWGWCTDYAEIVKATLDGYVTMVERSHASQSFSLHVEGNVTLLIPGAPDEVIPLEMYGSRVRSLFYLHQEITGKSASFEGTWIDAGGGQYYILAEGRIALPNPGGEALKTARVCFLVLRTPDVEVPIADTGSFVDDIESMLTRFVRFIDNLLDSLIGTGIGEILSAILSKIAILLAQLRALGVPYIS